MVPFAKVRLGVGDGVLGILLLALALGGIVSMLATGLLLKHLRATLDLPRLGRAHGLAVGLTVRGFASVNVVGHPVRVRCGVGRARCHH